MLCLAINLWVVSCREVLLDLEGFEDFLGEIGCKGNSSIRDNIIREAMQREDMLQKLSRSRAGQREMTFSLTGQGKGKQVVEENEGGGKGELALWVYIGF